MSSRRDDGLLRIPAIGSWWALRKDPRVVRGEARRIRTVRCSGNYGPLEVVLEGHEGRLEVPVPEFLRDYEYVRGP